MNPPLRALIIEDCPADLELLLCELRRSYEVVFQCVETAPDLNKALFSQEWDVILADYAMPSFDAPAALKVLQAHAFDIPFLIVSGAIGEEAAVAAMKAGAHDVVSKTRLPRLLPATERALREAEDRRRRQEAEAELLALYKATSYVFKADNLTDLGHQIGQAVRIEFGELAGGVLMVDRKQDRLLRLAGWGNYHVTFDTPFDVNAPGLVAQAIRTGQLVYAPDVIVPLLSTVSAPGVHSELVVPLRTAQGVIGVLDLQRAAPDAFSQRDQRILTAVAERAAAALEIVSLYEEIHQRATDLEWRVAQRTADLRHAKERAEVILNNTGDALILALAGGGIEQVNPAFQVLFGYAPDEVFAQPLASLIQADQIQGFTTALSAVLTSNQPLRIELRCRRKDGSLFDGDIALAPLTGYQEKLAGVICSIRDITRHKRAEEELRRTLAKQKDLIELKSRFASMLSHEFRTPFTVIHSALELLMNHADQLSEARKRTYFESSYAQMRRLIDLLNNFLTLSRAESVELEYQPTLLDLETFAYHIVGEIRQAYPTGQIQLVSASCCSLVYADEELLRQIITNLLSNAVKYSPESQPVTLGLSCDHERAVLRVRDAGMGIPADDLPRLFEPFHRARNVGKIQGTGLGLAIVRRAVEMHGGTIDVASHVGAGTTFTIVIPNRHATSSAQHAISPTVVRCSPTIRSMPVTFRNS